MDQKQALMLEYGPIKQKALELFEAMPLYEEEDIIKLAILHNRIMEESDPDTRCEMIAQFDRDASYARIRKDPPEKIPLWPRGNMPNETEYTDNSLYRYSHDPDFEPYLIPMLLPEGVSPKGAVVICAGGDHAECCVYEGYAVGRAFNEKGYQSILVLNRPNHCPWSQAEAGADASRAIRWARLNADNLGISPDRVAFAGFSNGGLTGEGVIRYYSGQKTVHDHFPDYVPDELDGFYGAPDAFLCVYGPRFVGGSFDWNGTVYPPTFFAVGCSDKALDNLHGVYPDLLRHHVPVEVHTFLNVPHGQACVSALHPSCRNFDMWVPLADLFLENVFTNGDILSR